MIIKSAPALARVKECFTYDPTTGIFYWKINTGKRRLATKRAGCKSSRGYWLLCLDDCFYYAHRIAWYYMTGEWPNFLDHINRVRDDNRFSNLRPATIMENQRNKTGKFFKGVCYCKQTGRWRARIKIEGRQVCLGRHDSPEKAAHTYDAAALEFFGSFAVLNFPEQHGRIK